jgi:hypothetical protein
MTPDAGHSRPSKSTRRTTKTIVRKPALKRRTSKSPQQTAAQAVSTALAQVSRVVIVNFHDNNQGYAYHTRDESLGVGDFAVVISPHSGRGSGGFIPELNGYPTIVKVVDVKETSHSINAASKWIVQKVDLALAIAEGERRQRIEVLEAKITKARREAEARVKLEQLREFSPELSGLLDELDQLKSGA